MNLEFHLISTPFPHWRHTDCWTQWSAMRTYISVIPSSVRRRETGGQNPSRLICMGGKLPQSVERRELWDAYWMPTRTLLRLALESIWHLFQWLWLHLMKFTMTRRSRVQNTIWCSVGGGNEPTENRNAQKAAYNYYNSFPCLHL